MNKGLECVFVCASGVGTGKPEKGGFVGDSEYVGDVEAYDWLEMEGSVSVDG